MKTSSIYHGGSSVSRTFSTQGGGNGTVINLVEGGSFGSRSAGFSTYPQSSTGDVAGEVLGLDYLSCDVIDGFADKFKAVKVVCSIAGPITSMGCFVQNTYGARQINFGIYDLNGNLIDSTGIIVITGLMNSFPSGTFLSSPVNIVKDKEYWLGAWGNGCDIPTKQGFGNFSTIWPIGSHCIEAFSIGSLPLSFNSTFPYGLDNDNAPFNVS